MIPKNSIYVVFLVLLGSVVIGLSAVSGLAQASERFVLTGNMITPRYGHTATLLRDGRVLITGGKPDFFTCLRSAEIYDPTTGTFTATGDMLTARGYHSAILLPDGRVLVVGRCSGDLLSADLYDPATGTFSAVGPLFPAYWGFSTTLLKDGRILLSGGATDKLQSAPAAIYDPASGVFTPTGDANTGGYLSTANLLGDGTVLITGGVRTPYSLLYKAATGEFSKLPSSPWLSEIYHSATSLATGKVLIAGGAPDDYGFIALSQAALFDPASGAFKTSLQLLAPTEQHTATLLKDGRVLITGGYTGDDGGDYILSGSELYDPSTETFTWGENTYRGRVLHTATLLNDGRVLIVGGITTTSGQARANDTAAELFVPASTEGQVPRLSLDKTQYCVGDLWALRVDGAAALSSIQLMGISQGAPWQLPNWRDANAGGALIADGAFGADAVGDHTIWAFVGGKTSNSILLKITSCPR
jgi:hypothetical protein